MKFWSIIGNPPYQDETVGDQKTFAPPIYHLFLDQAYNQADCVNLIHPARFLFNAGSTPKSWNLKMLNDPHLQVLYYEQDNGHLFDEVVFNDSVAEFWSKRQQLADYFDESHDEDIFDYIPPQKTNQIFTPRWVVSMMVDQLEENNPGCFDDPDKTFADLYMKSGLYITEIVKRLYRSERLKTAFPDEKERIRHILQKQVYSMAPTRIIYLIATNYILGFDDELKGSTHNFVQADAAEAAKAGTLNKLVDQHFGGLS